jgi:RND superfamily putative drug exporter
VEGFRLLERSVGPGALAPLDVLVDGGRPGGAWSPATLAGVARLARLLRADPEVLRVEAPSDLAARLGPRAARAAARGRLTDATGRYGVVVATPRHDYGTPPAQALARRARRTLVPAARVPARVDVGGAPAAGVDFIDRSYTSLPYLVVAVLVVTYVLLLRAFRSLILPLKAVLLNVLSVGASYGVLVLAFQHGLGEPFGLVQTDQVDSWIPIFLFAMLFGLSMDYEVFLLTRMREAWDDGRDNAHAVSLGLERTGRIVSAAATIMVSAFAGLVAGSLVGLQEFGLGLAAAILIDATLVRAILVPSAMQLLGRWNWYLPAWTARLARVAPSPLRGGRR